MSNTRMPAKNRCCWFYRKNSTNKLKARKPSETSSISSGVGSHKRRGVVARPDKHIKQLSILVSEGDCETLREILSITNLRDFGELSFDLFHCACVAGSTSTVAVLIRYGASVNAFGKSDMAPLHVVVKMRLFEITSLLLSHGANINQGTKFERRTALHIAALLGDNKMIRFLLENQARVDQGDIYGSTPLQLAARMGHVLAVQTLLDLQSAIDEYDNDGWTALHLAAQCGNIAVVRLLLERNAHVDCQNKYGRTPLHWACAAGHVQVTNLLLSNRASITTKDRYGKTALDHASTDEIKTVIKSKMFASYETTSVNTISFHLSLTRTSAELIPLCLLQESHNIKTMGLQQKSQFDEAAHQPSIDQLGTCSISDVVREDTFVASEVKLGTSEVKPGTSEVKLGASEVMLGASEVTLGASEVKLGTSKVKLGASKGEYTNMCCIDARRETDCRSEQDSHSSSKSIKVELIPHLSCETVKEELIQVTMVCQHALQDSSEQIMYSCLKSTIKQLQAIIDQL